jgi:molecular chaperone HscA
LFAVIEAAIRAVEDAATGGDPGKMHASIEALDAASKGFATRRMNLAIARAFEGRKVDDVSAEVER